MKYKLVQRIDDRFVETTGDMTNVVVAFEVRGFTFTGINANPRQRLELQGQPKFSGLCGPMYDGPDFIRYEDQDAYRVLSN